MGEGEREQRQAAGEDKSIEYSPRAAMCQQLKLNLVNWKNTKHTYTHAHWHTHTHTPIQLQMQFTIFTPIAIKAVSEILVHT